MKDCYWTSPSIREEYRGIYYCDDVDEAMLPSRRVDVAAVELLSLMISGVLVAVDVPIVKSESCSSVVGIETDGSGAVSEGPLAK